MKIFHRLGFVGTGNMSQAIIKGICERGIIEPQHIFASNRTPGKLQKLVEQYGIAACATNEEVVENSDVVVLGMKPQDLSGAVDPLAAQLTKEKIVLSLAAGITFRSLQKKMPQARIVRLIPNTPTLIAKGVIGCYCADQQEILSTVVEDIFSPLGKVVFVDGEDKLSALMIACSSGVGFIFELMCYWRDWLEEHGFEMELASELTNKTFIGAGLLAGTANLTSFEDLVAKVASKKGITESGLESMRELEIERALRYSFEKAGLRDQELAKLK